MASAAPSSQAKVRSRIAGSSGEQLTAALHPWRTRLILQQVLSWTARGALAGLMLACLMLLVARLLPWATAPYWAIGIVIACLLVAFGAALWFRPSLARATRLIDALLSLHDRLSTAWEMRNEIAPLFGLQRRDALKHLGKHSPGTAIPLRPGRSSLFTADDFLGNLVILFVFPNPRKGGPLPQDAFHARIATQ